MPTTSGAWAETCATDAVKRVDRSHHQLNGPSVEGRGARAIRRGCHEHARASRAAAAAVGRGRGARFASGRLERHGLDQLRRHGRGGGRPIGLDPMLDAAKARLEVVLVSCGSPRRWPRPARAAGRPPAGVRDLERAGRIVVLEPDLAYAMPMYRDSRRPRARGWPQRRP